LPGSGIPPYRRLTRACIALLLAVHAGLLAWSATRHSPTQNEPAHLVAGLVHWKFGRFDVYCVNPPLTHWVAAFPVVVADYNSDWSSFSDLPTARHEFLMGDDFLRANRGRAQRLVTYARWGCLPISLCGALLCYQWSRELWGSNLAGLISLSQWCFDPNILAHAELITPDCAAATFGLGAGYSFWRYQRQPSASRALLAGLATGLALLSKSSWLMLLVLWPLLYGLARVTSFRASRSAADSESLPPLPRRAEFLASISQLALILGLALYLLNLGYGFDGTFSRLSDFQFVSGAMNGCGQPGEAGNRFQHSWLGSVRLPFPHQFVRGLDLQKKDFEDYPQPSFLRGEWRDHGWWYYYGYGLLVKTTHGTQLLLVMAVVVLWRFSGRPGGPLTDSSTGVTYSMLTTSPLWLPPLTLLVLASSQTEFSHHVRYALPVLGFAFVFIGSNARLFSTRSVSDAVAEASK
jgi:hypothetical protein